MGPPPVFLAPALDGWEATRRLKAEAHGRQIPIVAITGLGQARLAELARQAGCDYFIEKPCPPDQLVFELQQVLAGSRAVAARADRRRDTRAGPKAEALGPQRTRAPPAHRGWNGP